MGDVRHMADVRFAIAVAAGAGLVIGLAGGALLRDSRGPSAPSTVASAGEAAADLWRPALEALAAEVQMERDARRSLAAEVELLRTALGGFPAPDAPDVGEPGDLAEGTDATDAAPEPDWFDEQKLIGAGLSAPEAARLRERFDAQELNELYLKDRAAREGWLFKPRYGRELRQLRNGSHAEVGDADYDRMLFAAGRNNRVRVAGVLQNSPAANAQLGVGDRIVSYAGVRIFDVRDLTLLTTRGEPGEPVRVVMENRGVERSETVPRGPLGVRLEADRATPDMLR